jgi:S1-C subfamily serine protease
MAVPRGSGSGFIWNKDGYIVTNYHVVEKGDLFLVTLINEKQYEAKLIGGEPRKDIAVLKLKKKIKNLTAVEVGSSKNLKVGQQAIAIGNPFGLDRTMTTGIVSAIGREIPGFGGVKIKNMIQTDAAINQGNSGGPLFDSDGRLIGMNTMIYSPSGASAGIGFAVPVEIIKRVVPQLIKYGKVTGPGVGINPLPDEFLRSLGMKGVAVRTVDRGTSAYRAGLRGVRQDRYGRWALGDIIVGINNFKIENFNDLYETLENFKVGDKVKLKIIRKGKVRILKIKLVAL